MTLYEQLLVAIPTLSADDFAYHRAGTICLQNDGEGLGDYIKIWEHPSPIPDGFKLGK
jgi:hypothetical protein